MWPLHCVCVTEVILCSVCSQNVCANPACTCLWGMFYILGSSAVSKERKYTDPTPKEKWRWKKTWLEKGLGLYCDSEQRRKERILKADACQHADITSLQGRAVTVKTKRGSVIFWIVLFAVIYDQSLAKLKLVEQFKSSCLSFFYGNKLS